MRIWPPLGPALLTLLAAACGAPEEQVSWDAPLADVLVERAERQAHAGDLDAARETAQAALDEAVRAGSPLARARALRVLGEIESEPQRLVQALALLELLSADAPGVLDTRGRAVAALAALEIDAGAPSRALERLQALLAESAAVQDFVVRARIEASAFHQRARALRALGQHDRAHTSERRAELSLSLLPGELPALRQVVLARLGDDAAAAGDHARAFEYHSQAVELARGLEDERLELAALLALARDLAGLRRFGQAADYGLRVTREAQRLGDDPLVTQAALETLEWLDALREPADSPLRRELLDTLVHVDSPET